MIPPRVFLRRARDFIRRRALERDLRQQIASHLDEAAEEFERMGLSPEEARRAAGRRFGDVARVHEAWNDARSFLSLDCLLRDLRHAARALRRSPGFSATVLIVLAIGIAALTTTFTLLDRVVLRPLPFPESDRLVVIRHSAPGIGIEDAGLSHGLYWHYLEQSQSFERLALYREQAVLNLRLPDEGRRQVLVTYASAALFDALRTRPALGRLFTEQDGQPGFMNLQWKIPVLLSHTFWTSHFAADPDVIGRTLTVNDSPREVVGVLPADFTLPPTDTQIWVLLEPSTNARNMTRNFGWEALARLRPGASSSSAEAELNQLLRRLESVDAEAARARFTATVTPLKSVMTGSAARVIWLLFGGMAVLLLITCANAGGLFLIRAEHREYEMAIRRSLGAYAPHLARLFFIEAFMLTGLAAAGALVCVHLLLSLVPVMTPVLLPRSNEIQLDAGSIVFAFGLAVILAGFYGVLSLRRQKAPASESLARGGGWASSHRRSGARVPQMLLILQMALALTLMVGAGLMAKTYRNLANRPLGFSSGDLLTVEIALPSRKAASQHVRVYRTMVEEVVRLPEVMEVSAASFVPLTPGEDVYPVEAGGAPIPFKFFVPGYFQAMGTRIVDGFPLALREQVALPHPVFVSAALARRLYPGESAIGKPLIRLNENGSPVEVGGRAVPHFTIAGVVENIHETTLRAGPSEIVYVPVIEPRVEQSIVPTTMRLVVRSKAPLLSLVPAVKAAIVRADPDLSIGRIQTMDSIVAASRAKEAFVGSLLLAAAAVSVLLGGIGIYGSVAQVVRRRRREIGIRLALGATRADVVKMVTIGSLRSVLLGGVAGLCVAVVAARFLRSLLFGVDVHDPMVFAVVTAILMASAGAAALLAARRGANVAPLLALRGE